MRTLIARAPARIDFGGGWTDVPPYSDEMGGCVCNLAIARYATVNLAPEYGAVIRAEDPGGRSVDESLVTAALARAGEAQLRVSLHSDFPVGAGLGGSSAAGVAIAGALAAWKGLEAAPEELAEESRRVEVEELGIAGGRQDHYAAAFGGALGLTFENGETRVRRIPLDAEAADALEEQLIVLYTGQSRISGETITAVLDGYHAREPRVMSALASMKTIAHEQVEALAAGDIDSLGRLVGEQWTHQRTLHPAIPTPRIDEIVARAASAGALGAKALGASGGGCVLVVARRGEAAGVRAALDGLGEPLDFAVARTGFSILEDTEVSASA